MRMQKYKNEVLQKLTEEQKSIQLLDEDVCNKVKIFNDEVPGLIDYMLLSANSSKNAKTEDNNQKNLDSITENKSNTTFNKTDTSPDADNVIHISMLSSNISNVAVSKLPEMKFDPNVITNFYGIIELIIKFYNVMSEEKFQQHSNQLVDILTTLKNYKSFNDDLSNLQNKYTKLNSVKKEFYNLINEEISECTINTSNFTERKKQQAEKIEIFYCIDLRILPMPMKNSLKKFLKTESSIKISFLGLRKADPNGKNVKPVQETDSDWPKLVRIFPLLHWSYKNVWDFLRCANVPYCSLYNEGYTSLGAKSNTSVNSGLKFVSKCDVYYKPAFLLHEDITEREGRC
ncbi:hypothetical protein PGB90_005769 [Kerria lacca]